MASGEADGIVGNSSPTGERRLFSESLAIVTEPSRLEFISLISQLPGVAKAALGVRAQAAFAQSSSRRAGVSWSEIQSGSWISSQTHLCFCEEGRARACSIQSRLADHSAASHPATPSSKGAWKPYMNVNILSLRNRGEGCQGRPAGPERTFCGFSLY